MSAVEVSYSYWSTCSPLCCLLGVCVCVFFLCVFFGGGGGGGKGDAPHACGGNFAIPVTWAGNVHVWF